MKSHAAAARVAAGIDAMLELRAQNGFSADDIESMALGIPKIIQGQLITRIQVVAARRCACRSAAAFNFEDRAAPGGITTLGVPDFEAGLKDRGLHDIETRTTIALDDEVEAASNELSTAARVTVTLRDDPDLELVQRRRRAARRSRSRRANTAAVTQELSGRVGDKTCAEIVAMARDLDALDPRWLGNVLAGG